MENVLRPAGKVIDRKECIEKLIELCKEYSDILGMVILFGSVARGDHTERSDAI